MSVYAIEQSHTSYYGADPEATILQVGVQAVDHLAEHMRYMGPTTHISTDTSKLLSEAKTAESLTVASTCGSVVIG